MSVPGMDFAPCCEKPVAFVVQNYMTMPAWTYGEPSDEAARTMCRNTPHEGFHRPFGFWRVKGSAA